MSILRTLLATVAAVLLTSGPALAAVTPASEPYVWKSVVIGGGGFVTGIITHPKETGLIYCRTDVGRGLSLGRAGEEVGRDHRLDRRG
jgi:hypothetical protein